MSMSRTAVHSAALLALVAATALALPSLFTPSWITYTATSSSGTTITDSLGLRRRCHASTARAGELCIPFPDAAWCAYRREGPSSFCAMWRAAGWLVGLAAAAEVVATAGCAAGLLTGRYSGKKGWWWRVVVGGMAGVGGVVQVLGMGIVAYLFDHDDMFLVPGYRLDSAWYLCAASAALALLAAVGLAVAGLVLPSGGGDRYPYQLLREEPSGV